MPLARQMKIVSSNSTESDVEGSAASTARLRVAFASSDLVCVDEHFGAATKLAFYEVGPDSANLVGAAEFSDIAKDGNENKLIAKLAALDGCHAVFSLAVGSSAVRQLMAQSIQPIKLGEALQISVVLDYLQNEIRAGETLWIAKALQPQSANPADRVESLLDEAWEE